MDIIGKKEVCCYFHHYRIPKAIRFNVLNEMIEYGLFKNAGKHKVIIQ